MKIIPALLLLALSACSVIPSSVPLSTPTAGTPQPKQGALTVNSAATVAVYQTTEADLQNELLQNKQALVDERAKQLQYTVTVEYIAVLQLQSTQTQAARVIEYQPTADFIQLANNRAEEVRATAQAQDIQNKITEVELAERRELIKYSPLRATGDFIIKFGAFVAFVALGGLAVVLSLKAMQEKVKRQYDIAMEIYNRDIIPDLNKEDDAQEAVYSPSKSVDRYAMPVTRLQFDKFAALINSGVELYDKSLTWQAGITTSEYGSLRTILRLNEWASGDYAANTLRLTSAGGAIFEMWKAEKRLPEGYKFIEENA